MSYITKRISGYCPEQDCEYTVNINYHPILTLAINGYKKGNFSCGYTIRNTCNQNTCPIFKNAPKDPE